MRNGQNKRMRGRNRKSHNPLTRVYESNGPEVKIRGTPNHVAEKYIQLARDAQASGDPVAAENYYQHAEHYFRLIAAAQEQFRQSQPFYQPQGGGGGEQQQQPRGDDSLDDSDDDSQPQGGEPHYPREMQQPPYPPRDNQSYQQRDHNRPYQQREHQQHQPQHQHNQPQHQHNQPQHQHHQHNQQHGQRPQQSGGEGGNVDRLPSFITGGQQQPQQGQPGQQGQQGYGGQNSYDNQPDRFPLHRRRRRGHHRGPRPDMSPQGMSSGGEGPDDSPAPSGPPLAGE